jgi:hypothetical protein
VPEKLRPSVEEAYPDRLVADCTPAQALRLAPFDHHRVVVGGRPGVLLTYDWPPVDAAPGPVRLRVVFHYALRHPPAPAAVQAVVDELTFDRPR